MIGLTKSNRSFCAQRVAIEIRFPTRYRTPTDVEYTQISVLRNSDAKKRDTNGLLPYKFVWEEVPPILYGADTLLYDPLALFEGKVLLCTR